MTHVPHQIFSIHLCRPRRCALDRAEEFRDWGFGFRCSKAVGLVMSDGDLSSTLFGDTMVPNIE